MATATVQVRMDEQLKKRSEAAFHSMGLTMSTAFNLFCTQVLAQGRIPFDIVLPETPESITKQTLSDIKNGKNLVGPFKSTTDMMEYLDA